MKRWFFPWRLVAALVFALLFLQVSSFAEEKQLSLTLKEAIALSLEKNLSIADERLLSKSSEAEVMVREGEFDPAFNLGLSQSNTKNPTVSLVTSGEEKTTSYDLSFGGKINTGTTYELKWAGGRVKRSATPFLTVNPYYFSGFSLSLTQPILKGFGKSVQESSLNVARNSVDVSMLAVENKASAVIADTSGAFWRLHYARSGLKASVLSLELAKSLREEIRARIDAGALAPVEIYKADAEVALREEALIGARKAVYDAEDALKAVMNIEDWETEILASEVPAEPSEANEEFQSAFGEALEKRPDYRAALIEQKNKALLRKYYDNQRLPSLNLTASSGLNGVDESFGGSVDESTSGDFYSWLIGITFNIPLQNKIAKGNYMKARHEEDRANLNILTLKQRITAEVREAIRAVRLSRESVLAARASLAASKTRLETEEAKLKLGMATINDVFTFQEDYSRSMAALDKALSDHATATVMLEKAKGTLLKMRGL